MFSFPRFILDTLRVFFEDSFFYDLLTSSIERYFALCCWMFYQGVTILFWLSRVLSSCLMLVFWLVQLFLYYVTWKIVGKEKEFPVNTYMFNITLDLLKSWNEFVPNCCVIISIIFIMICLFAETGSKTNSAVSNFKYKRLWFAGLSTLCNVSRHWRIIETCNENAAHRFVIWRASQ